jgi:Ca2+-dependent lipid-binding protein
MSGRGDEVTGVLSLTVEEARDLQASSSSSAGDVFCQVALLDARHKAHSAQQSEVHKHTNAPSFHHTFHFDVDSQQMAGVRITIYRKRRPTKRFLGQVVLSLHQLRPPQLADRWFELVCE